MASPLLFCDPAFHDLNAIPAAERRRFEHHDGERLVGVLDGVLRDGVFESGFHAPFGGPDLVRPDLPVPELQALLEGALAALEQDGAGTLRVKARPSCYSVAEPVVQYLLLQGGFTVEHCDLTQHVDLAPLADADAWLMTLKRKRSAIRKALRDEGFAVRDGSGPEDLATCHALLDANRAAHGRPPGLPLEYLGRALQAFGDRVHVWLVEHAGTPVAAAITYDVLDDVDFLVAWGDHGHELPNSPMDVLAHHLVSRAIARGARILDLGPSSEKDGTPNHGLVQYKRTIGALPGTRLVLVRSARP